MNQKSMWGDLGKVEKMKGPAAYLREQAKFLNESMDYRIQGEVQVIQDKKREHFLINFDVVVPEINHYRYTLLQVEHPMDIYPLSIEVYVSEKTFECSTEQQFLDTLQKILSSAVATNVIAMLRSTLPDEKPMPDDIPF